MTATQPTDFLFPPECHLSFKTLAEKSKIQSHKISVRATEQNREEYNRINGLTVFVQNTEREAPRETSSGHTVKLKDKLPALPTTSDFKNLRRTGQNATKRTTGFHGSMLHGEDENKRQPERSNYTNTYIKTRLAKIDGRKLGTRSSQDLETRISRTDILDLRRKRSSININGSPRLDTVPNRIKTKRSKEDTRAKTKRDIIAENITKQGKKQRANPVRILATSNFVYEFNPHSRTERTISLTSQTRLHSTHNSNRGLSSAKTAPMSAKSALNGNTDLAKRKRSALPEINWRADFIMGDSDSIMTSLNQDACLPILNKADQMRTSCKPEDKHERGDVDREVEHVKSTWRVLREERNWKKERARIDDACTTRWSKIVNKMTREMDRIQKRYLDSGANRYLRKSATNVLRAAMSKSSSDKDAEVARSTIFPKGKARFMSAGLNRSSNFNVDLIEGWNTVQARFDEATKHEHSNEDSLASQRTTKTRPARATPRNIDVRSVHTIGSSEKLDANATRAALENGSATRVGIRTSIDEHLRSYIGELRRKLLDIEEDEVKERSRNVEPSVNNVADIFASLNIGSCDNDSLEKRDNVCVDTGTNAREGRSNAAIDAAQTTSDTTSQNWIVSGNKSAEDSSELVDAKSAGASKQSSATSCKSDAFIEIGLNVLNKSVPRDELSQMLQSEYLRKNLLL